MAYLKYPEPGTELGPCEDECEHPVCQATRTDAAQHCTVCAQPLGYGVPVQSAYVNGQRRETHLLCTTTQETV